MDNICSFCSGDEKTLFSFLSIDPSIIVWLSKIMEFDERNLPNLCYTCLCTIEDINYFLSKCITTYENFKSLKKIEENENNEYIQNLEREEMMEEYLLDNEIENDEENENYFNPENMYYLRNKQNFDISAKHKQMFKCLASSLEFNSKNAQSVHFTKHSEKHVKKSNYKCRFCEFECNDREKVAYHMKRDHLNNNRNALFKDLLSIVIDQRKKINCFDKMTNAFNNDEHCINLHSTSNKEVNNLVNETQSESGTLENNIDYIKFLNLADVYECKICKIKFSKKNSFNKHWDAMHLSVEEKELRRQKNKGRDQHLCPECGKSLQSAFKLDYHLRMHKNDRRYKCGFCPKSYISKNHLETHMQRHSGNESLKTYLCEICQKKCRTPSELKVHQRFHRNDRPFKCEYCQRAFYLKSHLRSHVNGHINERTYICDEPGCVQSYRDKNAFKRHKDSHMADEEKNYECDICKTKFSTFGIMKDHRRKSHSRKHKQNPLDESIYVYK